jgi:hypothetical protein
MKCSKLNKEKSELLYPILIDFKNYLATNNLPSFKSEGFINFINSRDYDVVGYTWHQDESKLEAENYGKTAISIHTALECFANTSEIYYVIDDNGKKISLLNKLAPKHYKFI